MTDQYVAFLDSDIYGCGHSPEAALENARDCFDADTDIAAILRTTKATPALAQEIMEDGVCTQWAHLTNGTAGTLDEKWAQRNKLAQQSLSFN